MTVVRHALGAWRSGGGRWVSLMLAMSVAAAACGGSTGSEASVVNTSDTTIDVVGEEPMALAHLGELVVPQSGAITTSFDSSAKRFEVADGVTLDVPSGAFEATTEVRVAAFDLAFDDYVTDTVWGQAYVVSTMEDVALATPVFIEIARPSDSMNVIQFTDGNWSTIDVEGGATTRIPIVHFSEVTSVAVDPGPESPAVAEPELEPELGVKVPGGLLANCIFTLGHQLADVTIDSQFREDFGWLFGQQMDDEVEDTRFFFRHYAVGICVRALINVEAPEGQSVSIECVGRVISEESNLSNAIAKCAAEDEPGSTVVEEVENEVEHVVGDTVEPLPDPVEVSTDAGQLEWEGTLTYFDDSVPFEFVDSYVSIIRDPGTDNFEVTAYLEYRTLPASCSFDWFKTYEGTGSLSGDQIIFDGPDTVTTTSTCAGANIKDNSNERRVTIEVTESGLAGFVSGGEFEIVGTPPTPVAG